MYSPKKLSAIFLVLSFLGFFYAQCQAETQLPQSAQATTSNQTYLVQPGDIFGKVCQKYQPEGVSLKSVMAAFYDLNKNAFKNGDQTKLIVGSTLIIPSAQALGGPIPVKGDSQLSAEASSSPAKAVAASENNSATLSKDVSKDAAQPVTLAKPETTTKDGEVLSEQNTTKAPVTQVNKTASTSTWPKNIGIIVVILIAIGAYLRKRKKLIEEQAREIKRLLG